jgi:methylmalonyl-CoA/ethylmalonyl-CoA epimerase
MSSDLEGLLLDLHHVAIVVRSIDEARDVYVNTLGLVPSETEHVADQKVNVLICHGGSQRIELVEPAAPDSPVTKFLEKRGGGLHHLAWRVTDLDDVLARLKERGTALIDEEPRAGAHGMRIAFLHPRATGGVLTELVELPAAPEDPLQPSDEPAPGPGE